MRRIVIALGLGLGLGSGCGAAGALHQGTLMGECASGDEACSRRHPMAPLAVGAKFHPEVSASIAGSTAPNLHLDSAAPDVLSVENGALVAKQQGAAAVLMTTDDGSVVDFVHVWVAPITAITLARRDGDRVEGTLGLTVGEDVTLVPALWNGAQRLDGVADVTWASSTEGAIAIMRDGSMDRRRIRARAPGKTTLTVALGDSTASIDVEVVP